MPITNCTRCGADLTEGEYIACGPCGAAYLAQSRTVNLDPPGALVEPAYRRVAGVKVPLDELPSPEDVS